MSEKELSSRFSLREFFAAHLIFAALTFIYFFPVFFLGKSVLIENMDHGIIFVRFADRAQWIEKGIVPLWNPREFAGRSFIDEVPPTHLLNLQAWVMAGLGHERGYNVSIALFVYFAGTGTWLLARRRFGVSNPLALAAGSAAAFSPMMSATMAALFAFVPFGSYYFYRLFGIFPACAKASAGREEKSGMAAMRLGALASLPVVFCLYTVEPRNIEAMFWGSIFSVGVSMIFYPTARGMILRNTILFGIGAGSFFFMIGAPILVPMITETFGQVRLGAGAIMPAIFRLPTLAHFVSFFGGMIFPINDFVMHEGLRSKLFGEFSGFYSSWVQVFFLATLIFAGTNWAKFRPLEKTIFAAGVGIKFLIVLQNYIPGFLWLWTYLLKTGRFLDGDVGFLLCLVASFVVLDRMLVGEKFDSSARATFWIGRLLTAQFWMAVFGCAAIVIGYFGYQYVGKDLVVKLYPRADKIDTLNAIWSSFQQRWIWLIAGYALIAFAIRPVLHFVRGGALGDRRKIAAALILAPVFLTWGYWPFNTIKILDRSRPEGVYLDSRSILDRGDIVDFNNRKDITEEMAKKRISHFSPRSLNWYAALHRPSSLKMLSHFVTREQDDYRAAMYSTDTHYERGYEDRYFFYPQRNNLFHMLGVNFFLAQYDVFDTPFVKTGRHGEYFSYENPLAAPRFGFADTVITDVSGRDALYRLLAMPYEQAMRTAFIDRDEAVAPEIAEPVLDRDAVDSGTAVAEILHVGPNEVSFKLRTDRRRFFIMRDAFDKRWHAELNGPEIEIHRVNHLFRGVWIPPGEHLLVFRYEYPEFFGYCRIAAAGLSLLMIIWGFSMLRVRPSNEP